MLLLAVLPTLGRFAAHHTAASDARLVAALGAMCAPSGLGRESPLRARQLQLSADLLAAFDTQPAQPHHGEDCDYCVLLGGLNLPAPAVADHAISAPVVAGLLPASAILPRTHHPTGLGSRGPPA